MESFPAGLFPAPESRRSRGRNRPIAVRAYFSVVQEGNSHFPNSLSAEKRQAKMGTPEPPNELKKWPGSLSEKVSLVVNKSIRYKIAF
jgi:hypothetical protein